MEERKNTMSAESALKFMGKVIMTPELQKECRKLSPTDLDGLVKVAKANGFDAFSKDDYYLAAARAGGEWMVWAQRMKNEPLPEELSDADLEQVAGGKGTES